MSADCTYIHELADVEEGAVLGEGTRVWRFAHIRSGAVIGNDCVLGNRYLLNVPENVILFIPEQLNLQLQHYI